MYKIIIVDDEVWVSIGVKKLILKTGLPFQIVGEANNGIAAYEKVMAERPDILISDIRMPGISGLELMKKLNENNLELKVIFISGYAEFEYARAAIQLGAFDYLLKPIEEAAIRGLLERFISQRKNRNIITNPESDNISVSDPRLKRIIEEIKQQYKEEVTLGILAEKYGLSIGYLSSLIKNELGVSFSKYITMKRIQDAKKLLKNENLSIDEIAEMVGYRDYFYFIKVFKNFTGISPSKYRKSFEYENQK